MATVTIDRTTQRYSSGPQEKPRCVLIHTTEGGSWPPYGGGGYAPHSTIKPLPGVGIQVREHIPFGQFAKALENRSGGVETNTSGVMQFELVGTCDERNPHGVYFWPDADDVVLEALAAYLGPIMDEYDIPAVSTVAWKAYNKGRRPSSYGLDNGVRLTGRQWLAYRGILGHQHVPENNHGDPGDFPIDDLLHHLGGRSGGAQSVPVVVTKTKPKKSGFTPLWVPTGQMSVKQIQRAVGVKADGLYGARTKAAVTRYQRGLGVAADGLWGPATEAAHKRGRKPLQKGLLLRGSRGARVRRLQKGLNRVFPAYADLAVDGVYGAATQQAVKAFQRRSDLTADGVVGAKTRRALQKYGIRS